MRHKVSELEGPLLDAAVAKAENLLVERRMFRPSASYPRVEALRIVWADGKGHGPVEAFSSDWSQAGPLIEREGIGVSLMEGGVWTAVIDPKDRASYFAFRDSSPAMVEGPTPLIAAMRAFVRAKLGDEVELP